MNKKILIGTVIVIIFVIATVVGVYFLSTWSHEHKLSVERIYLDGFKKTSDGIELQNFKIKNNLTGTEVWFTNYGPSIIKLLTPDKKGVMKNIILGYDSVQEYENDGTYQGKAAIGRFTNRIGNAQYVNPEGKIVKLSANNNGNTLHGGPQGWDKKVWAVDGYSVGKNEARITFSWASPDGDQGFEGNVDARVSVILTENDELVFDYYAVSDKATPIEMAFHGYFNLDGQDAKTTILKHTLKINADKYQPVDEELIPNADLKPVDNTKFDFRTETKIGEPARFGKMGYDDRIVFEKGARGKVDLYSPDSGIYVTMDTDQRTVQFYTGYFLEGNKKLIQFQGLCIEAGNLIDAPNIYDKKSWTISNDIMKYPFTEPGKPYRNFTSYKIGIR